MKKYKIGVIRVVTLDTQEKIDLHGKLLESYYEELETESKCIPDQPTGVHSPETYERAVPKIVEMAKEWKGIDGLVISCAGDPGLRELREILDIPVVGGGESTAFLATMYGEKFGTLGLNEEAPEAYIKRFGRENIVGAGNVEGITNTVELMADGGSEKVIDAARVLKEQGAEVIALSCTGMATIGIAKEMEETIGIPVIDPVMAEGLMILYECKRKYG